MNPSKGKKCSVCATPQFERNNYFYGKQFTVRDLLQEQSYLNEKRQLINRMVLGWGVVCGLEAGWDPAKRRLVVNEGMALDCCGHEIIVCEPQHISFDQYEDQRRCARENPRHEEKFVLCLEYHECSAEPVELPPVACGEQQRTEFNRVRDGFTLKIKKWGDACPKPHDHLGCLNRYKHDLARLGSPPGVPCRTETIHEYLCHRLSKGCPECECCECVVLATILVRAGKARPPDYEKAFPGAVGDKVAFGNLTDRPQPSPEPGDQPERPHGEIEIIVDACVDRRFVYNNQLLYDLIDCYHGDLPHIVDFSWRNAAYSTREIDWDAFVEMMKRGLTVYFDREMEAHSLNRHTFVITFFHEDPDSGNLFVKRIPCRNVTSVSGECFAATWLPDEAWFNDELVSQKSQLRAGVDVEITLRGSRIRDHGGKGLDGCFLRDRLPTGNGTQGTDFIDWFHVRPRSNKKKDSKGYEDF